MLNVVVEYRLLYPSDDDLDRLRDIVAKIDRLEFATKILQGEQNVSIDYVRVLFDELVDENRDTESFKKYLSSTSEIVHSQLFESSIVKVLLRKEDNLTEQEAETIKSFLLPVTEVEDIPNRHKLSDIVEHKLKRHRTSVDTKYHNMDWIPATSNVVERLFSKMKLFLSSDKRACTLPLHFEAAMMLLLNRDLWDVDSVNFVLHKIRNSVASIADVPDFDNHPGY